MRHLRDRNDPWRFFNAVDDAMHADTNAPQVLEPGHFETAKRTRGVGQRLDPFANPLTIGLRQPQELALRG